MDRNAILSGLMSSFQAFATSDARGKVEKVLKFSGNNADLIRRADVKAEVVAFRYQSLLTSSALFIEDDEPTDIEQTWEVIVFVEQGDTHSIKEARYDRLLEITDQIMDWSIASSPYSINADLLTITLSGGSAPTEFEGYLSTTLTFKSQIKLQ